MLDARGAAVPAVRYWGPDLGPLDEPDLALVAADPAVAPSSPDRPLVPSVLPTPAEGWTGLPGIEAHRVGMPASRSPLVLSTTAVHRSADAGLVVSLRAHDDRGPLLDLDWSIELTGEGIAEVAVSATAAGEHPVAIARLAARLPVPARARDLLDFSGLWAGERRPQRGPVRDGVHVREQRQGRPGHDAPFLTIAGTPGFGFAAGEVWAMHHAWSGDSRIALESLATGHRHLHAEELLQPGEVVLAPGERHDAPVALFAFSGTGLDGLSDRFHPYVRRLSPPTHRPVVLNTWEAVYFDQSLDALSPLVDAAADLGVERFVLDDGWFAGRTDDRRALGDWVVDPERWPEGLHPLVDRVESRGMEFGLWVEPEMVSPESRLAHEHPDWLLASSDGAVPPTWRWQHALDLANPEVRSHLLGALDALLTEYPIRFLKWDHNRALMAGGSAAQTRALYALLDELRARHPELAIESCASGGGRVDLGIARRTHRFWTSDTNDALERQSIQRWTSLLVPLELLGGHVGAPRAHITGRTHDLSLRLATALFGHAGIEWDVTRATDDERALLRDWVATVRRFRPLVHAGRTVRVDPDDDAARLVHGVVALDRAEALFSLATLASSPVAVPAPLRLPGLDPDRRYRVAVVPLGGAPRVLQDAPPAWFVEGELVAHGRVLAEAGIPVPLLAPEQALVLHAIAVD
ncbi:MAG: alpha-galactosidase [Microcella sp.]|uniref:alpha-galactosidase n=1 Tax=Microcella sp. TaxID=1913979 RepID=UPI0027194E62|nr:alpha-galactosidase [Microcella sp.]MDO8338833.1 alpha-galactosidase [Microcella sp.]